jgi:hypothetical protein
MSPSRDISLRILLRLRLSEAERFSEYTISRKLKGLVTFSLKNVISKSFETIKLSSYNQELLQRVAASGISAGQYLNYPALEPSTP